MKRLALIVLVLGLAAPAAAQQSVVAKYRAQYPTPLGAANSLALLKQVAGEVHGGLLAKPDGSNCGGYACDIICFSDSELYDVLGDSDGAATPAWNRTDNPRGYRCEKVAPVDPLPPPPPPPPAGDAASAELQRQQLALLVQLVAKLDEQNAALAKGLADLKAQIASGVKIRF